MTIEQFIDEIRECIAEAMSENPSAPEPDVTREVVENMLLGEDLRTVRIVKRRFGL